MSLDVSNNTALEWLYCTVNQLTSLDVNGCTALIHLFCTNNQLVILDVSSCTALINLYCQNNRLTSLDVSGCPMLTTLVCENNQLTATALNNLFGTLPSRDYWNYYTERIYTENNPGTYSCDKSIAENKNWKVL